MTLKEKIQEDLNKAVKTKEELKSSVLRLLSAAILNKEKEKRGKLAQEEELIEKELIEKSQLTEEEAIEYLIQKDIPTHIWAHKYNRPMLKVVPVEMVPTDRSYRNAWKLAA